MLKAGDVVGKYVIGRQLGKGTYGEVCAALGSDNNLLYAVKAENNNVKHPTLLFEKTVLEKLKDVQCVPRIFAYQKEQKFSWMAIELAGPSLFTIFENIEGRAFSIVNGLKLGKELLRGIEDIHYNGVIHRDLKPANIVFRLTDKPSLCIIDFGLARIYKDKDGSFIPQRKRIGFRGTKTYASINSHKKKDLSRRDDLYSWFYILFEILTGKLPWIGIKEKNKVKKIKKSFDFEYAMREFSPIFGDIYLYITSLKFNDTPNYDYICDRLDEIIAIHDSNESEELEYKEYVDYYKGMVLYSFKQDAQVDDGIIPNSDFVVQPRVNRGKSSNRYSVMNQKLPPCNPF